jgi:hypothetical protein
MEFPHFAAHVIFQLLNMDVGITEYEGEDEHGHS